MIDDARAALGALQDELRQLDQRLADSDGAADPLAVAECLVGLSRLRAKVAKLKAGIKPPSPAPRNCGDQVGGDHRQ
jgi:hypothetical protein